MGLEEYPPAATSSPWESVESVPAGGRAAAVGVVAVGQAHGLAVAGNVPGMAFDAQVVTITGRE